jgi:hypothetical protein
MRPLSQLRPRFSLRVLLALLTVLCIALATHVRRAKRQQHLVRLHELNSSKVYYDYMRSYDPARSGNPRVDVRRTSPLPSWLLKPLGRDFFHNVVEVHVRDCDQLRDLDGLPGLVTVTTTGNGINDEDIEHLARLRRLRRLIITGGVRSSYNLEPRSELTDRALDSLANMRRLEALQIDGSFSASGIAALAESRSLREVNVTGCDDSVNHQAAELFRSRGRVQSLRLLAPPSLNELSLLQENPIVEW